MGLNGLNTPQTRELAHQWTARWVRTNYMAFAQTGAMYEKVSELYLLNLLLLY